MKKPSCKIRWLLGIGNAKRVGQWCVSGKPKNFGVKIKSIVYDVLGDTCPSRPRWSDTSYIYNNVCVYPKSVNGVNEILQHAISFRLFETLILFGTPHYDLRQAREGSRIGFCLWAPRLRRDATEAYANIVECVMYVFQLLTRQWQHVARTNRHPEETMQCLSVDELCSSAGWCSCLNESVSSKIFLSNLSSVEEEAIARSCCSRKIE